MVHVLKWKEQPKQRSRSWAASIAGAREEIADIQDETPSLNRAAIKAMWDKCYQAAKRAAEAEMDRRCLSRSLTWNEVFEAEYEVK
jgi:hypothetical protein